MDREQQLSSVEGAVLTNAYDSELRYVMRLFYSAIDSDEHLEATATFLAAAKCSEALLFLNYAHCEPNHLPQAIWRERGQRLAKAVEHLGRRHITCGLQFATIGFLGSPVDPPDTGFQYQVDRHGVSVRKPACPFCPNFHEYLRQLGQCIAVPGLSYALLEDEFAYKTGEWMCFCPLHMTAFAEALGKPISREEWAATLWARDDVPDVTTKLWADVQRRGLLTTATVIAEAIHKQRPDLRLGAMAVNWPIRSLGSEYHHALLRILSGPARHRALVRPGWNHYSDYSRLFLFPHQALDAIQRLPPQTERLMEIDAGGPWTPFKMGTASLAFACEYAIAAGQSALSFLLFPGDPGCLPTPDNAYVRMLQAKRKYFQALTEFVKGDWLATGIDCSGNDGQLDTQPQTNWDYAMPAFTLARLGIALCSGSPGVSVIHGSQPYRINKHEWAEWSQRGMVLDVGAIAALEALGENRRIGGAGVKRWSLDDDAATFPARLEWTSHPLNGALAGKHFGATMSGHRALKFALTGEFPANQILSYWLDSSGRRLGPAEVALEHAGRRVLLLGYPLSFENPEDTGLICHTTRQPSLQGYLEWVGGKPLPAVCRDGTDVLVHYLIDPQRRQSLLILANFSTDKPESLAIDVADMPDPAGYTVQTIDEQGAVSLATGVTVARQQDHSRIQVPAPLTPAHYRIRVFKFTSSEEERE